MRKFRIRTCSSNARAAPVPPPEGPEEAAEGSPFTETWEIRAIVAEAVTAALAQAMPRIIVAALTGNNIVSCPPPVARHPEPIGEARARPSGFSPRPTGDRRGSATGRVADLRQSRDERRGCAVSGRCPRPRSRSHHGGLGTDTSLQAHDRAGGFR